MKITEEERDTIVETLEIAEDYIRQYAQYAEEMCEIGRGFKPSSPYSVYHVRSIIKLTVAAFKKFKD